ncbi:MAG: hypothetical protein ACREL7_11810 [Longimicrobiales bacterium]
MWKRSAVLCVVALLGTSAHAAAASTCDEIIEGEGVSGTLLGARFVTRDGGTNAILLEEVGVYQMDDGSRVTVRCAGWLFYWGGSAFQVLHL